MTHFLWRFVLNYHNLFPQWDFPVVVVWTLSDLCLIGRDPTEREPLHNPWCWCHWRKLPTKEGETGHVQLTDKTFTTVHLKEFCSKKCYSKSVIPFLGKTGMVYLTDKPFPTLYINKKLHKKVLHEKCDPCLGKWYGPSKRPKFVKTKISATKKVLPFHLLTIL